MDCCANITLSCYPAASCTCKNTAWIQVVTVAYLDGVYLVSSKIKCTGAIHVRQATIFLQNSSLIHQSSLCAVHQLNRVLIINHHIFRDRNSKVDRWYPELEFSVFRCLRIREFSRMTFEMKRQERAIVALKMTPSARVVVWKIVPSSFVAKKVGQMPARQDKWSTWRHCFIKICRDFPGEEGKISAEN